MAVFEKRLRPSPLIATPGSHIVHGLAFADLVEGGPPTTEAAPRYGVE